MNLIVIIILTVILVLVFCLVTLVVAMLQKHRKKMLDNFAQDLNDNYQHCQKKPLDLKQLSVTVEEIKEDIYYCTRAVIGKYDNPNRVINNKNFNISALLRDNKFNVFYHYKIINLGSSKFHPLNKLDVLLTKTNIYLYHPLEPEIIAIDKIKDLTIFWEKNPLIQRKEFFPGLGFKYQKQSYFLLFQTYNELLKFICYLNLIKLTDK